MILAKAFGISPSVVRDDLTPGEVRAMWWLLEQIEAEHGRGAGKAGS